MKGRNLRQASFLGLREGIGKWWDRGERRPALECQKGAVHQQTLRKAFGKATGAHSAIVAVCVAMPVFLHQVQVLCSEVGNQVMFSEVLSRLGQERRVMCTLLDGKVGRRLLEALEALEAKRVVVTCKVGGEFKLVPAILKLVRGECRVRVECVLRAIATGSGRIFRRAVRVLCCLVEFDGGLGTEDVF